MTNRIISIRNERDLAVSETIKELQSGNPVVFPTDTVYGIGALSSDKESVKKIFEIKGRSFTQSLPVLVADFDQAAKIAVTDSIPEEVKKFWPGPLTIIVPRRSETPIYVGSEKHTVGIRCPKYEFVQDIAKEVGPLSVTSANPSGAATPQTALEVAEQLENNLLVIDGGYCVGQPSTLIDLSSSDSKILRLGEISEQELSEAGLIDDDG